MFVWGDGTPTHYATNGDKNVLAHNDNQLVHSTDEVVVAEIVNAEQEKKLPHFQVIKRLNEIMKEALIECDNESKLLRRVIFHLKTVDNIAVPQRPYKPYYRNCESLFATVKPMLLVRFAHPKPPRKGAEVYYGLLKRYLTENRQQIQDISDQAALDLLSTSSSVIADNSSNSEAETRGTKRKAPSPVPQRKKQRIEKESDQNDDFNNIPKQNDNSSDSTSSSGLTSSNFIGARPSSGAKKAISLKKERVDRIEQLAESLGMPVNMKVTEFMRRIIYCLIKKHNIKFLGTSSKNFYMQQDILLTVLGCMLSSYYQIDVIRGTDFEKLFSCLSEFAIANQVFIKDIMDKDALELVKRLV